MTAVPPLLEAEALCKRFAVRRGVLQRSTGDVGAVDGVTLRLEEGECFALVGESGSGKTTLGRCLIRLIEPTSGRLRFKGEDLLTLSGKRLRQKRRHFQMIFQDPYGSLNPRMSVERTLREPLVVHRLVEKGNRASRVGELLDMVGLPASTAGRYPHEFSGGQRQRIGIARALATAPELLVADEPVSALDVSVQAQIVNLLAALQRRLGLTLVFIAHDLAVVEQIADRVAVMYLGRVVEVAASRRLFASPQHPYTASLLSAIPIPDPARRRQRIVLSGDPPSPMSPPSGCRFHARCPIARPECQQQEPDLTEVRPGHGVACHYPGELSPHSAKVGKGAPGH
jgi:oligopeptide transport system ATP-binding protein